MKNYENLTMQILNGESLKIDFQDEFTKILTADFTYKIIAQLGFLQLYEQYQKIQQNNAEIPEIQVTEKIFKKYDFFDSTSIYEKHLVLLKSYYHHKSTSDEFSQKIAELIKIWKIIYADILAYKPIPEFDNFESKYEELSEFTLWFEKAKIIEKYSKIEFDEGFSKINEANIVEIKKEQKGFFAGIASFMGNLNKAMQDAQEKNKQENKK